MVIPQAVAVEATAQVDLKLICKRIKLIITQFLLISSGGGKGHSGSGSGHSSGGSGGGYGSGHSSGGSGKFPIHDPVVNKNSLIQS